MIRLATLDDVPEIVELTIQLGYQATTETTRDRLSFLLSSADHDLLVFESGSKAIAFGGVTVIHGVTTEPYAELMGLVVADGHRSQGIGAKLMGAAEEWGRSKGCDKFRVRTNTIRAEAHRFYERLGYGRVKEQRIYEKGL